ncbi:MAG TPA: AMP-binding protein [Ktedonobacteraceae bacterium]|nr:AMP-binding protein [Ktedonobacteraceae bacterium]HZU66987.1 AMP-binding protein [Ktedonobacteraceae bacterium]
MMKTLEGFAPYPPEFIARYREAGYWEDRSMADFFAEVCQRFAPRIVLVAGDERITYGELDARAERLALHLLKLGLRPGDRFVLQLPNVPEFVYFYLALQKAGIMPVMALPPHRYTEISHFVKLSEAVGYALPERLGNFEFAAMAERIRSENPHLRWVFVLGDTIFPESISIRHLLQTESGLPKERLAHIEIDPLLPALFLLSGGTTGVPKLIPRTHNDYIYNSKAAAAINDIHPDDALLLVLPMAHNFPLACPGMQGFLMHGARCVLSTSTQAQDVFSLIEREKITHLELVPTLLIRLLNDPLLKEYDLSSVRIVNTGGQKLQPEVKRRTEALIPSCKVQEVFGMAEGLLNYVRLDDPDELRYETVGRPVSPGDELRLIDDEGNEVPEGATGELLVRGPYTLRGYFRAPEHNAKAFTPDGFYKTGDLLRRHPSGNYIVEGRKKDLINRGGEKISAEEIENLMLAHPAILNAACVPMPDPMLGERVCAFVILRPGMTLMLEELTGFLLAKGIAKFKLPERLEVVDDFPMSKFGKVAKNVLTQQVTEKLAQAQV